MTNRQQIMNLRQATKAEPLRILMSACLTGITCGYDGTSYGEYPAAMKLLTFGNARIVSFCPEDFVFGTPREMCDIHGGNGFDVLDGKAKVITESGIDWTERMIRASEKMLTIARQSDIELAVMMDISAACGSQVIYSGNRFAKDAAYQIGAGVCAAQLMRNGFTVISQRDFASLEIVYTKLDPRHPIDRTKTDHHETEWYRSYFNNVKI